MGRDNVLSVRQKDGSIKALLNTCTHRGNAVCRAEEGNTKAFMCTYHGWSYDLAGNLDRRPGHRSFYKGELDKSKYGPAPGRADGELHGFVFATMDATAPPLEEYLGADGPARHRPDRARGDIEIVPGIQKFIIDCNWKFAVDNLFDWYHPQVTHMSAAASGIFPASRRRRSSTSAARQNTWASELDIPPAVGTARRHGRCVGEYGHAIGGPTRQRAARRPLTSTTRGGTTRGRSSALGPVGCDVAGHPNIFPNAWITTTCCSCRCGSRSARTRPRSGGSASSTRTRTPEARSDARRAGEPRLRSGRPARAGGRRELGAVDVADPRASRSRRIPQLLKMDLGRGKVDQGARPGPDRRAPPASTRQLWTYHCVGAVDEGPRLGRASQATEPTGRPVTDAASPTTMRAALAAMVLPVPRSRSSSTTRRRCSTRTTTSDWVALFTDDTHYFMPIRRTRLRQGARRRSSPKPGEMAYFDDDKMMLAMRWKKFAAGPSWAEDPPSRTRHLITNVRVVRGPRRRARPWSRTSTCTGRG